MIMIIATRIHLHLLLISSLNGFSNSGYLLMANISRPITQGSVGMSVAESVGVAVGTLFPTIAELILTIW